MGVDIVKNVVYLISGAIVIMGAFITFVTMQVKQNMNIEQMKKEIHDQKSDFQQQIAELKEKSSSQSRYQIKTEKNIIQRGSA